LAKSAAISQSQHHERVSEPALVGNL